MAPAEFHPLGLFVDADELVNGRTGRRLPRLSNGTGAEAEAFHDEAHGVVYKVFKQGGNGSIGNRLVIDQDGMALLDAGTERDVAEKVWVLNELGGVPTEIVGYTADGELMVKQPLGQRGSVDAKKTRPANRAVNRAANLVAIPARILARPNQWKGGLHYSNINGAHVLIDDLHAGNYVGDTMGRGRILDLATHVLTADEIARQPSLREWIHAQQEQARATGPAEFARRRQDGKSKPPTETPAFKEWFGDSQVVDAAGRPLVVYHGTNADISAFDPGRLGQNKAAPARIGFWFADDPLYAANHGEAIMPVYLRALKPYIVQGDTLQALANDPQGLQRIKDAGYDAIWQPAKADMLGKTKVRTAGIIAVFSPTQIKSATGNRGTFDAANPRIDYARKRKNPRDAKVVQAELDQVQQQIDGLKESQEEQADIEARGAELTKKQAALQKELVRAKRDDQVAASLKPLHDIDDRVDPLSGAVIVPSIVPMDRKAALRQKFTPDRLFQQPANHAFSCMSPAELGA
ncbi:MAG TPA: hypothetical protein PLQ52_11435 [Lacunisphaera sp.]|nr:hypothetical protein [Lacunisphaera sp.]